MITSSILELHYLASNPSPLTTTDYPEVGQAV